MANKDYKTAIDVIQGIIDDPGLKYAESDTDNLRETMRVLSELDKTQMDATYRAVNCVRNRMRYHGVPEDAVILFSNQSPEGTLALEDALDEYPDASREKLLEIWRNNTTDWLTSRKEMLSQYPKREILIINQKDPYGTGCPHTWYSESGLDHILFEASGKNPRDDGYETYTLYIRNGQVRAFGTDSTRRDNLLFLEVTDSDALEDFFAKNNGTIRLDTDLSFCTRNLEDIIMPYTDEMN